MTKREAALILGVRESATAERIKDALLESQAHHAIAVSEMINNGGGQHFDLLRTSNILLLFFVAIPMTLFVYYLPLERLCHFAYSNLHL